MRHIWAALPLFFFVSFSSFASETAVQLAPIVKEGTPGDLLMEDPVVSPKRGDAEQDSGSGTILKSLSDALPVPVAGTGLPGNAAQFRGLGRSAEDTDVQALGVPLNPPQGGGFDLSVFPQFIWSGFEYQVGPALGTFDPRGTAGSLTLAPWTSRALYGGTRAARASAFYSTASLQQVAAAGTDGSSFAVVVGNSSGDAQGPSLGFSGRFKIWTFHLLMTDIDAKTPGPGNLTPNAHQQTLRAISIAQIDLPVGDQGLLKSSLYYDWSYLRYDDPSSSALPQTQDRVQQIGSENVLLWASWKFGAGLRGVKYQTLGRDDLSEAIANLSVSRSFEAGGFLIEPTLRAVGVSSYGMLPEASLGAREEWGGGGAWFTRVGYSRHFPSLLNRYYSYPGFPGFSGFVGNPALAPEKDYTAIVGVELKRASVDASLMFFGQFVQDTQVRAPLDPATDTLINQGNARIASVIPSVLVRPLEWLDLGASATLSVSDIGGLGFPGLPGALVVGSVRMHPGERWEARGVLRAATPSVADAGGSLLPSYQEVNTDLVTRWGRAWTVTGRMENVLGQTITLVKGYPSLGRTFSVLVAGEF